MPHLVCDKKVLKDKYWISSYLDCIFHLRVFRIEPVAQNNSNTSDILIYPFGLCFIKSLEDGKSVFVFRLFTARIKSIEATESLGSGHSSTLKEKENKRKQEARGNNSQNGKNSVKESNLKRGKDTLWYQTNITDKRIERMCDWKGERGISLTCQQFFFAWILLAWTTLV